MQDAGAMRVHGDAGTLSRRHGGSPFEENMIDAGLLDWRAARASVMLTRSGNDKGFLGSL